MRGVILDIIYIAKVSVGGFCGATYDIHLGVLASGESGDDFRFFIGIYNGGEILILIIVIWFNRTLIGYGEVYIRLVSRHIELKGFDFLGNLRVFDTGVKFVFFFNGWDDVGAGVRGVQLVGLYLRLLSEFLRDPFFFVLGWVISKFAYFL